MEKQGKKEEKKKEKAENLPLPRPLIEALKDREITIQVGAGTIYQGKFEGVIGNFVVLSDATVIGKRWKAQTKFLALRASSIAHVHLKPDNLEEIGG